MSPEAVILYALMLDRRQLSVKNNWTDARGTFILFSIAEIMETFLVSKGKATAILKELTETLTEDGRPLVAKKRSGCGKLNRLYVTDVFERQTGSGEGNGTGTKEYAEETGSVIHDPQESRCRETGEAQNRAAEVRQEVPEVHPCGSRSLKNGLQEVQKTAVNNNHYIYNKADNIQSFLSDRKRYDNFAREAYKDYYRERFGLDILHDELKKSRQLDSVNELIDIMTDAVCSTKPYLRINGDDIPQEYVKSRLLKINIEHIRYVLFSCENITTRVRNMRSYLLTAIYNAPSTMSAHYTNMVCCDMYERAAAM